MSDRRFAWGAALLGAFAATAVAKSRERAGPQLPATLPDAIPAPRSAPEGSFACDVRPLPPKFRRRAPTSVAYEVKVSNDDASPAACMAYIASRHGREPLPQTAAVIAPHCALALVIDVPLKRREPDAHLMVEFRTEQRQLAVASLPLPAPREKRRTPWGTLAAGFALMLGASGVTLAAVNQPRIVDFSMARTVPSGKIVNAVYAARGSGTLRYEVAGADGRPLDAGVLEKPSGVIPVRLPVAQSEQTYSVRIDMQGPLGHDARVSTVSALVAPPPRPAARAAEAPRIAALSVDNGFVAAHAPIVVRYLSPAKHGSVLLTDDRGAIVARAPYTDSGITQFRAPGVTKLQRFDVVVRVGEGTAFSESRVGIRVAPPKSKGTTAGGYAVAPAAGAPFAVRPALLVGGGPILIDVLGEHDGLRIALASIDGKEIGAVNVAADTATVAFRAPDVARPARFIVSATFTRGLGEETVVRDVTVLPRGRAFAHVGAQH